MSLANRWICTLATCAVTLVLAPARSAVASSAASLFPFEADLFVEREGLVRLVLPADVVAQCHSGLADLRIFDRNGRDVPFLVDPDPAAGKSWIRARTLPAHVLKVDREIKRLPDGTARVREEYEAEFSEQGSAPDAGDSATTRLELLVQSTQPRFVRSVRVSELASDGGQTILAQDIGIFRVNGAERSWIPLSAHPHRISLLIEGPEDFYLEPTFSFQSVDAAAERSLSVVPVAVHSLRSEAGRTVLELLRPPGLEPEALHVETTTPSFFRHALVWDVAQGREDRRLGEAEIFRIAAPGLVEQLDVPVQGAVGDRLRLEIEDRDSPPLDHMALKAMLRPLGLVFSLSPARDGTPEAVLRFGGGRTSPPSYDLADLNRANGRGVEVDRILASLRQESALSSEVVRLGPVRPNPLFDPSPALSFAMQPGSEVDPRFYRRRRTVEVNPTSEGLSLVALDPEDAAAARSDLADVRVVDSTHRQWPYVLESAARKEWVELHATPNKARNRTSRLQFDFPVSPVVIDRVEIDPDSRFFDRKYELVTAARDGGERILAAGRLVRRVGATEPIAIDFSPQRLERIELQVEDGDDAPLVLRSARARASLPTLFLVAPAGSYTLLVGDPDADRPHYQVAEVRDVVLAVASVPAHMGPSEANPDYRAYLGLTSGDRGTRLSHEILLWTTLLGGVAALALLTLRAVRREGQGSESPTGNGPETK